MGYIQDVIICDNEKCKRWPAVVMIETTRQAMRASLAADRRSDPTW